MKRETLKINAQVVKWDFYEGRLESAIYPRVTIEFTNADTTAVEITSSRLMWIKGQKDIKKAQGLVLKPAERRLVEVIFYPDGKAMPPMDEDASVEWTARRLSAPAAP